MASSGTFVRVAWAITLLLLSISVLSTCMTVTTPDEPSEILSKDDRNTLYRALEAMVGNKDKSILPDRNYNAGRLFTKLIELDNTGKKLSAVIRLTRWTADCSVAISPTQTSKGSDLLDAWKPLVERMRSYLVNVDKGYQWVAVSSHTDWIDYYLIKESPTPITEAPSFKTVSDHHDVRSSVTDCTIQPSMLLSHDSAFPFSQLHTGDSLLSPDGNYRLTIPNSPGSPCVLILEDEHHNLLWNSPSLGPWQRNCAAALRSDGSLELWNEEKNILVAPAKPCSSRGEDCAGAASLAFMDGHVTLYSSVGNHLGIYWHVPN